jgi:hypothetical protein
MSAAGLACIYAGYVLFCGLPAARAGRSRMRLFLLNILPGALLALIGMSVITTQVKSVIRPHRVVRQQQAPAQPAGLHHTRQPADT